MTDFEKKQYKKEKIKFCVTYSLVFIILFLLIRCIFGLICLPTNAAEFSETETSNVTHNIYEDGNVITVKEGSSLKVYNPLPGRSMWLTTFVYDLYENECIINTYRSTEEYIPISNIPISCYLSFEWPDVESGKQPMMISYELTQLKSIQDVYDEGYDEGYASAYSCSRPSNKPSSYDFEYNKGYNYAQKIYSAALHPRPWEFFAIGYADAVTEYGDHKMCCASSYQAEYLAGYKRGQQTLYNRQLFNLIYDELEILASQYDMTINRNTDLTSLMATINSLIDEAVKQSDSGAYNLGYADGSGMSTCPIINGTSNRPYGWNGMFSMAEHYAEDYYGIYDSDANSEYASGYADGYTQFGCHLSCCHSHSQNYLLGYIDGITDLGNDSQINNLFYWLDEEIKKYNVDIDIPLVPSEPSFKESISNSLQLVYGQGESGYQNGYKAAVSDLDIAMSEYPDAIIQGSISDKVAIFKQNVELNCKDIYFEEGKTVGYQEGLEYGSDLNESVNILAKETSNTLLTILNTEVYGHTLLSMLVGIVLCIIVYVVIKIVGKVR